MIERLNFKYREPDKEKYDRMIAHVGSLDELDVGKFFFDVPLYRPIRFTDSTELFGLLGKFTHSIDGYCNQCGRETVFHTQASGFDIDKHWPTEFFIEAKCQRKHHSLKVAVSAQVAKMSTNGGLSFQWAGLIEKIGQTPSHADISIGELGRFNDVLKGKDRPEFVRAIGLAANGVYIGAFVYLRRVFERLVERAKDRAGDTIDSRAFENSRMSDKIAMLDAQLPEFMLKNKRVYGVLSKGIHTLDEEKCGKLYDLMKQSCLLMLEQEKELKEKTDFEKSLELAISKVDFD